MINPFRRPTPPPRAAVDPDKLQALTERTDARYDAMIYEGMSDHELRQVQEQREQAHANIRQAVFEIATGGYRQ